MNCKPLERERKELTNTAENEITLLRIRLLERDYWNETTENETYENEIAFERCNGILGSFPNSNRSIEVQLIERYVHDQSVQSLLE